MNKISLKLKDKNTCYFIIALLGLSFFVYKDLLLGYKVFLSSKYSMDMYEQFYPQLVDYAKQMTNGEWLTHIDFTNGLGYRTSIFPYMIMYLPSFFGVKNVIYLLGVFQVVKVVLSGILFYFYLKKLNVTDTAAMIGGLGYAYCGHMVLRQFWAFYSIEVLLVAFWLLSFEFYVDKKKHLLPFATIMFFLNCNAYYIVLYFGVFCVYMFIRLFTEEESVISKKDIIEVIIILLLFALIALGITSLYTVFNDVSGKINEISNVAPKDVVEKEKIFTEFHTYFVSFFQTVGLNILSEKAVLTSYLESPTFYIGLLAFVSIPVFFIYCKGKKRIIYMIAIAFAVVYFAVAYIRLLANAMSGGSFKLSSFWIILTMLFISMQSLSSYLEKPEKKALIIMETTLFIIAVIGIISLFFCFEYINIEIMIYLLGFIAVYGVLLLYYYKEENNRAFIRTALFIVMIAEVAIFSRSFIDNNVSLTSMEVFEQGGYNDNNLIDALNYIKDENDKQDYRVDKQFFAYRLCDSMALDYYGSYYYIGAMGDTYEIRDFYNTMGLPTESGNGSQFLYKKAYGTSLNTEINEILGFKYIFSKNPYIANFGYGKSFKKQFNDIFVFENEYTLPIVFGYNKVISYEEFNKLTMYEKQKALMKCCVVPNDSIKNFEKKQILKADDLKIDMSQYMSYKNKSFHKADSIYSTDEVFRESTILIKVEFDLDEPEYRAKLNYNYKNGFNSSYFIRLDEDDNFYYYEINGQYVSSIWFSDYSGNIIDPKRCEFYVIPWSEYYKDYINSYNHIKQNIVKVDHFSGYSVDGRIDMLDDGVLYFAAPYDDWKLYVDGKETEIVKTNIGFMGAKISKGYHKFKFVYENGTGISMDEMIKIIVLSSSFIWIFICNIVVEIKNKIIRKKDEKNEE